MRVGIIGSAEVAKSLAKAFLHEGHEVMLGSREPAKLDAWVAEQGGSARHGTMAEAAEFGELLALAVSGTAAVDAIELAGPEHFRGKVVIDATNPLDMSARPPKLVGGIGTSGGELIQRAVPGAFVVKAFNTVGNPLFHKPQFAAGPPDMFLCGDDASAKEKVARICEAFGWNSIDAGGMEMAHYLEAAAMLWVVTAFAGNHWNQAFKLLRA